MEDAEGCAGTRSTAGKRERMKCATPASEGADMKLFYGGGPEPTSSYPPPSPFPGGKEQPCLSKLKYYSQTRSIFSFRTNGYQMWYPPCPILHVNNSPGPYAPDHRPEPKPTGGESGRNRTSNAISRGVEHTSV